MTIVKFQMGRGGKRKHNTKNTLLGLPFQVISLESIMSLKVIGTGMKITDIRCHIMCVPRPDGTGVRDYIHVSDLAAALGTHLPHMPVSWSHAAGTTPVRQVEHTFQKNILWDMKVGPLKTIKMYDLTDSTCLLLLNTNERMTRRRPSNS